MQSGNRPFDIASNIFEESVTQKGNLETIAEDLLEFLSTSSDPSMASENSNHIGNVGTTIKYNMNLEPARSKNLCGPIG